MSPSAQSAPRTQLLSEIITRCKELCEVAERQLDSLPAGREAFMGENLFENLQQLELILRVLCEESRSDEKSDSKGFLSRIFGRGETEGGAAPKREVEPPRFDVAREGLHGNAATVPVVELLGFLANGSKTGVLWVDTPRENFIVGLCEGHLLHASSDRTPEGLRLGEILVGMGYLTRRQLDRFLQQNAGAISGEALLSSGVISPEELNAALVHQVQQTFFRLVHSKHGVFRFREGMKVALAHQVRLGVNQMLLDSARFEDEETNPELRNAALTAEWNSWQEGLSASVAAAEAAVADDGTDVEPVEATGVEPGVLDGSFLGQDVEVAEVAVAEDTVDEVDGEEPTAETSSSQDEPESQEVSSEDSEDSEPAESHGEEEAELALLEAEIAELERLEREAGDADANANVDADVDADDQATEEAA